MLVLVIGVTSEVGGRVASTLAAEGMSVRAMVRRPEAIDAARDLGVADVVLADLEDSAALAGAFEGARQVFLVSSPVRNQVELEVGAIEAAEHAGTEHIVKISNIPIAGLETGLHGNHRAVERRLDESTVESTVLQPSFFMSVLLRQLDQIREHRLVMPTGRGRIGWIDPKDIADCAAAVLAGRFPRGGQHVLTGPEAIDADELAARLGARCVQPSLDDWREAVIAGGLDRWLAESTVHLYEAIARGALADVSPNVELILGREPRSIDTWIENELMPQLHGEYR